MSWGAIIGATIGVGGSLLAPKSKAGAAAPPIDLVAEQERALAGNIANQGDIEQLIRRANTFTQGQANDLMEQAMPGYGELAKQFTGTAKDLLADPYALPQDVESNLARLAAERGISAGTKGEFNDFSLLRDFGINSLQYGQSRINQAQSITQLLGSLAPRVNPLSPMSFYVTPQQSAQVAAGNQSNQQAANNAAAAANNYNNANTWGAITQGIGQIAGAGISALTANANRGVGGRGAPTTYPEFLRDNPNSSANSGNLVPSYTPVDTNW